MGDAQGVSASLSALDTINNQMKNNVKSIFPTIHRQLSSIVSGDGTQAGDVCGLMTRFETDSEEDSINETTNKVAKNEINISRTKGLKKRINNEDIKQKFVNLENEHKKIHAQIKTLRNNIVKKDKTVNDLSVENLQLSKKYEALMNDINEKNTNLLEYATLNSSLEKQLAKRDAEISQLQNKCEKADKMQVNLLKDIEYYKSEISRFKEQAEVTKDYEEVRKKYNEIKRDNVRLGKKFRVLKTSDKEHQQRAISYGVLQKKFDIIQGELAKYRMENKRLKAKQYGIEQELLIQQDLHNTLTNIERENTTLKQTIANYENMEVQLQTDLMNMIKGKEHLEHEIKIKDDIIKELKDKMSTTSNTLDGLKTNYESTERYAELLSEQVNTYKLKCETLENELEKVRAIKSDSGIEAEALKEEVKKLKLRLGEMLIDRSENTNKTNWQSQMSQTEKEEEECTNCHYLRQEIEKLGYANLRLHKEKLNLKSNFQKLSVKTSKLELKMEELSSDKKTNASNPLSEKRYSKDREGLVQDNLVLTKKLKDVVENYDKLLKEYISLQQNRSLPRAGSSCLIQELQNHISSSQYAINTIEHKLNEEEGKLHASLYHLRTVKNKLSERRMVLK